MSNEVIKKEYRVNIFNIRLEGETDTNPIELEIRADVDGKAVLRIVSSYGMSTIEMTKTWPKFKELINAVEFPTL